MTSPNTGPGNSVSTRMVLFIVIMVVLAAIAQLFIKNGVTHFEFIQKVSTFNGQVLIRDRALVEKDGRTWVSVVDDNGDIQTREIEIHRNGTPMPQVLSGLEGDERVVVRGAFPTDVVNFFRMIFHWQVFIGLLFYFFFGIAWLKILADVPVSFAFPFLAISYIVIILGSYWFLGENINTLKILSIALIIAGVICLSRSDTSEPLRENSSSAD